MLVCFLTVVACGGTQQETTVASIIDKPYYQNPLFLARAWQLPVASTFKDDFKYQVNAAFCGPATAVNVFRSLDADTDHTQNTVFQEADTWYWKARVMGMTLDEMTELMKANSDYKIIARRNLSETEFRSYLRKANNPSYRIAINFHRGPLFGVNVGHFSPIGGYLEKQDLVFVLDVLEDYRPFLVPTRRLFKAMDTVDFETGKKRGLIIVHAIDEAKALTKEALLPGHQNDKKAIP